jgi:hypothetical protein
VILKSRTKPDRGDLRGAISRVEPSMVDESELKATLEEQLVLAAINRSKYVWRPAEAISQETGISVARVKGILERTVAGVIAGDTNGLGQQLYTTREHLSKTSADFTRQFFLVQESS